VAQVEAMQRTLGAEHAAVQVLAELGGRVSVAESPGPAELIRSAYESHRARRDFLVGEITRRGATPVGAEPAYDVDTADRSASTLLRTALRTETRCAEAYADQVARSTGRTRLWAVDALSESARRSLVLGGSPSAYPGLTELA
jgi:hypothetical protein